MRLEHNLWFYLPSSMKLLRRSHRDVGTNCLILGFRHILTCKFSRLVLLSPWGFEIPAIDSIIILLTSRHTSTYVSNKSKYTKSFNYSPCITLERLKMTFWNQGIDYCRADRLNEWMRFPLTTLIIQYISLTLIMIQHAVQAYTVQCMYICGHRKINVSTLTDRV